MLKRFYKSLIIIAIIATMGGYEAYACFVQGQEPIWNTYSKKKLDLEIDYAGYYNKDVDGNPNAGHWRQKDLTHQKFFNFDDVKPGDWGEGTISLHLKNQDAWGCAIIRPTENDDISSVEPELLEDDAENNSNAWDGELAQNLNFTVWADVCKKNHVKPGDNIYQPNCDQLLTSGTGPLQTLILPLADSENTNVFSGNIGPLTQNKDYYLGVSWTVLDSVGNIIQTDSYKADIEFYAKQSDKNKSFRCADITVGDTDKCVPRSTRACYSGNSTTKDIGSCRSGLETCTRDGRWGKCKGEVLPVEEICDDYVDNDCDGIVNNDCVHPSCRGKDDCDDKNPKTHDACVNKKCAHEKYHWF